MKITINDKEYESGKITREKYRSFCETFDSFLKKEVASMVFTDEDLDKMIESIVRSVINGWCKSQSRGE